MPLKRQRMPIAGIVVGALLTLSPVFGLPGVLFGMSRAFMALGSSGISDPKALSADISGILVSTAAGLLLCPVGIVIFTLSLIFYFRARNRTPAELVTEERDRPVR